GVGCLPQTIGPTFHFPHRGERASGLAEPSVRSPEPGTAFQDSVAQARIGLGGKAFGQVLFQLVPAPVLDRQQLATSEMMFRHDRLDHRDHPLRFTTSAPGLPAPVMTLPIFSAASRSGSSARWAYRCVVRA